MANFEIEYIVTQRVVMVQEVEAETAEEALRLVEEYEICDTLAREVDSLEYSRDGVEIIS